MKYSTLDFISCPVDRHFPLKLYAAEVRDNGTTSGTSPACEQYCGYRGVSLDSVASPSQGCEQCHSKTIEEGVLSCEHCGALYLITRGIPQLIPEELKSPVEIQLLSEIRSRLSIKGRTADNQAVDSFIVQAKRNEMGSRGKYSQEEIVANYSSRRFGFMNRVEVETTLRLLEAKDNDIVLDAGAGYGVMAIPVSQRCRYVVATDITFEVLQAFKEFFYGLKTPYFQGYAEFPEDRICLIQADMCHPPFRAGFNFTKALSSQVLCHIPGSQEKASYIKGISQHLKPGGTFVLTAFNYSLLRQLLRLSLRIPKEATLSPDDWTGYYCRFTRDEFRSLVSSDFVVDKLFGFHHVVPRYLSLINAGLADILEKMLQATPVSCRTGQLLAVRCHKRQ